jgi:hypothetical protein
MRGVIVAPRLVVRHTLGWQPNLTKPLPTWESAAKASLRQPRCLMANIGPPEFDVGEDQ